MAWPRLLLALALVPQTGHVALVPLTDDSAVDASPWMFVVTPDESKLVVAQFALSADGAGLMMR